MYTGLYDVNFKLNLDYQSMLDISYDTRGNRHKLSSWLCILFVEQYWQ